MKRMGGSKEKERESENEKVVLFCIDATNMHWIFQFLGAHTSCVCESVCMCVCVRVCVCVCVFVYYISNMRCCVNNVHDLQKYILTS